MRQETKRMLTYFIVICFFSWLLTVVFFVAGGAPGKGGANLIAIAYILIPGIAAVIFQKSVWGEHLRPDLGLYFKPNRWFVAALLLAVVMVMATNEVGLRMPGNEYSPEMEGFMARIAETRGEAAAEQIQKSLDMIPFPFFWLLFVQGLIGGMTVGALFALSEELGFRGLVLRKLGGSGFWTMALTAGLLWGIWAAPVTLVGRHYPGHTVAGLGMMVAYCLLAAPLYAWLRLKSGSVVAPAIYGGTVSSMSAIPLVYVKGESSLTVGMTGLPGMIVLAAVTVLLVLFDRLVSDEPVMVTAKEATAEEVSAGGEGTEDEMYQPPADNDTDR